MTVGDKLRSLPDEKLALVFVTTINEACEAICEKAGLSLFFPLNTPENIVAWLKEEAPVPGWEGCDSITIGDVSGDDKA